MCKIIIILGKKWLIGHNRHLNNISTFRLLEALEADPVAHLNHATGGGKLTGFSARDTPGRGWKCEVINNRLPGAVAVVLVAFVSVRVRSFTKWLLQRYKNNKYHWFTVNTRTGEPVLREGGLRTWRNAACHCTENYIIFLEKGRFD